MRPPCGCHGSPLLLLANRCVPCTSLSGYGVTRVDGADLAALPALASLDFSDNSLEGVLTTWAGHTSKPSGPGQWALDLDHCVALPFSSFSAHAELDLGGCAALQAVNLRNNDLRGAAAVRLGPAVRAVSVRHNPRLEVWVCRRVKVRRGIHRSPSGPGRRPGRPPRSRWRTPR